MADVSIKNLPEASQINLNDFLIVEGETGTNILKFSNFIIAQENTNFQPLLSSHTDSIDFNRTLLTDLSSSTLSLSSFFDSKLLNFEFDTKVCFLSTETHITIEFHQ